MGLSEYRPSSVDAAPRICLTRKGRWLLVLVMVLAVVSLQYLDLDSIFLEDESFPPVPFGKPGTVVFQDCHGPLDCGYMIVPKDYFNTTAGVATIALARSRAPSGHSKGTVFLNPGGPGGSGVEFITAAAFELHQIIGPDWDLLGFDPRGIGRTLPLTKCFPNANTESLLYENTVLHQGWTVLNTTHVTDPLNKIALTTQARQFLAINEAQAQLCYENMDVEDLKYMGTTTVVRDIDFMTRVLDGPEAKIHFWGASYGTIIGAYLVNMLPSRIGRAVIDGVVDPIVWANQPSHQWHKYWTSSAEAAYNWFLNDCSKVGPGACALAKTEDEDPDKIKVRIERFIQDLVARPLAATANGRPGYITSGTARGLLFFTISVPSLYFTTAHAFAQAMSAKRDGSELLRLLEYTSASQDLSRLAVVCADSPSEFTAPTAEEIADEFMWGLANTSAHFGAAMDYTEHDGGCEFWPTRGRAPERFTGPFNASLEYPLLIIGNTADPDTPIANALVVNEHMANSSTLLIQNGPGHTSMAVASLCTLKAQLAYWAGHPPKNGTVCELSAQPFHPTDDDRWSTEENSEDWRLLLAADGVGRVLEAVRTLGRHRIFDKY